MKQNSLMRRPRSRSMVPWTTRFLLLCWATVAATGCHDLTVIPRADDGGTYDSDDRDTMAPNDGGPDGTNDIGIDGSPFVDMGLDGSPPIDGGRDAGDDGGAPLISRYGGDFTVRFPIRGAVSHHGGVLVVGRDQSGDRRADGRQALAAWFNPDGSANAFSLGGTGNDQFFAVTQHGSTALALGITRGQSFGGNDLLFARFVEGALHSAYHLGTTANESGYTIAATGDRAVVAGNAAGDPTVYVFGADDGTGAMATTTAFGSDGRYLGVWANNSVLIAVGRLETSPVQALITAFDPNDLSVRWSRALEGTELMRLLDVTPVGDSFVAVGSSGPHGLRVAFQSDGTIDEVETVVQSLNQVDWVDGNEQYVGADVDALVVGRRVESRLVYQRLLSYHPPPTEGRLASGSFVVGNTSDGLIVSVSPLNRDGRALCGVDRIENFEAHPAYLVTDTFSSRTFSLSTRSISLATADDPVTPWVHDVCD